MSFVLPMVFPCLARDVPGLGKTFLACVVELHYVLRVNTVRILLSVYRVNTVRICIVISLLVVRGLLHHSDTKGKIKKENEEQHMYM